MCCGRSKKTKPNKSRSRKIINVKPVKPEEKKPDDK
jgi:hypothetical protein